jgi:hypothetical protein
MIAQMFEVNRNSDTPKLQKLDIVDFGTFPVDVENLSPLDPNYNRPEKHVFFAGKVFQDDFGVPTFINVFTIVFD